MRTRFWFAIPLLVLLLPLTLLRHHIANLSEVARTYATFYPYIARNQGTLYRYPVPESDQISEESSSELVPRIIHQIFLTGRDSHTSKYDDAIASCQAIHPDWKHNLWTDESASAFIAEHYPDILPHYAGYKQSIQRANVLRYALLDHFGGVYLDLDITCLQPLDDLRHLPWLTPGAYPAGVNNAFILSRPGHSFLRHLLNGLEKRDLSWGMPYIENMLSTGCMFFSNQWMSYARSLERMWQAVAPESRVYILADESGDMDPHMLRGAITTPLFKHGGASSWHGWDAAFIVMVGAHYQYFLAMMAVGAAFAVLMIWSFSRSKANKRRRWFSASPTRRSLDKIDDDERIVGMKEG